MDANGARAKQLARSYLDEGGFLAWFETLYAGSGGDASRIPWADLTVNPHFASWVGQRPLQGGGRRALVVGCGLGDDAEELARRGFAVTAFDISPTAIKWCRERFAESPVDYCVVDLLAAPATWQGSFDFVFEAYTIQSLPASLREAAIRRIADFVRPSGRLLVICRGRDPGPEPDGPPWPLTRTELSDFTTAGLREESFEDFWDNEEPPNRRFRVAYSR